MAAQGELEWQAAQSINISVDLIEAAKIQLTFLSEVERYPCLSWNHEAINKAIHRYTTFWLPLAAAEGAHLVPPLDCAWIWHCHRLSPVQYAKDCEARFGKTIDAPLLSGAAHYLAKLGTAGIWTKLYKDEPYNLDLSAFDNGSPWVVQQPGQTAEHSLGHPQPEGNEPQAGYSLADAVARQRSFAYQVSRPYMSDPSFLKASLMRYKGFLHLARIRYSGKAGDVFLVPTYDIDLFWHAHQLSPVAYQSDTIQLIGQIFNHDDTDSDRAPGQKLDVGYAATCRLWGQTFGQEYVRAGVLYRGEAPAPVAEPPVSASFPVPEVLHQSNVTRREVLEAHIAVLGARNVRVSPKSKSTLFVRLKVLQNCKDLKLKTPPVAASADPEWRHVWSLECETATKGLLFELWKKSGGGIISKLKGSQLLGRVEVPWATVLAAPTLSLDQFFPLLSSQTGLDAKPPALHLSVSVTPPTAGPFLLRTEPLSLRKVTDDDGVSVISGHPRSGVPQAGRWISRTVIDHAGKEVYAVRIKAAKGCASNVPRERPIPVPYNERVICVHQGSWTTTERTLETNWNKCKIVPEGYVATAEHQEIRVSPPSTNWRQWSLPDGQGLLDITIGDTRLEDPIVPNLQLTGHISSWVILVPGRQMQYSVQLAKPVDEEGFVTMIRYGVTHPQGKATALFNWKSGNMEVEPDESVVLVVLLCTAIGTSMFDIYTARFESSKGPRGSRNMGNNQWGAVKVNTGVRDPRDNYTYVGAGDPMFNTILLYNWWAFSPVVWYGGGGCGGCGGCGGGCGGGGGGAGGCGGGGCGGGGCGGGGGGGGCGGGGGGCGGGGGGGGC